ncbi:xanthine dehydrogenase family protein molybdopterin-binding subunit [Clostridium tunisiense]|uniref:xanthine dehydrogenase family protein molybdopterin-binding subunit n=1 Tax=Clostridium tunisiense TaxID=219748 RepID=UPI000370D898|nr:xanthine dehydrogenase family protein molybdopterin-binding subunit [Clostridium tunisiense]
MNRFDAADKIRGEARYIGDMFFEEFFYAKTLRSTMARAKILSIEYPELPEGYYIVDKNDIPNKNRVKIVTYDMPFFAEDTVNYIGEPIALVVGKEKNIIEELLAKVKVNYEILDPIYTIEEASCKLPIYGKDNLYADYHYKKGDIQQAYKEAYKVFTKEYETGYQEHIYLEPQGVAASYKDGKVTIYGSMQCPYYVKDAVVEALGFEGNRVQIIQTTTGGAFGGKEEYPSLTGGHVAFATIKCNKPVVLIFDRDEDIECTTKRHPSKIKVTMLVDKYNKIIGIDNDIRLDGGAYCGLTNIVLQRAMFTATGVYNIPNVSVRGRAIATNTVPGGGFRGFGAPQGFFALEMHMEYIAKELGLTSLEFKKINLAKTGDLTSTGGVYRGYVPTKELIDRIEEMSQYSKKYKEYKSSDTLKGIGMSLFFHGGGFTGSGERDHIKAVVKLRKYKDDSVEILISNVEMGQGTQTTLRKIVAMELKVPINKIILVNPDTDRVPNSGPTVASRTIMIVGKLLQKAAIKLKECWISGEEQQITENYKFPDGFYWDDSKFEGDAYNEYSWGANVVEVLVNPLTFEVKVLGVYAVFDIGVPIDEKIIRGQIDGGMLQGLGHGSIEKLEINNGRLIQRTNTDYVIPTALDFPKIESATIRNPYENGPFGAKSAGELTFIGAPVAYALAIENALGIDICKIPVTPEYLMEVMNNE